MGIDFNTIFTEEVFNFAKIIGTVFALVHFIIGVILVRQITRMNRIVETRISSILSAIAIFYLLVLTLVLLLLIFA